jgi:hypothetical protein
MGHSWIADRVGPHACAALVVQRMVLHRGAHHLECVSDA